MRPESRRREDVEFELSGKKILPLNSMRGKKICRSNSGNESECGGSCSVERIIFIRRVCFETLHDPRGSIMAWTSGVKVNKKQLNKLHYRLLSSGHSYCDAHEL
jgi:hypothetical protein